MSGASFLLIALAVGVLGTLIVLARNRQGHRPDSAMLEFRREMEALAPPSSSVGEEEQPQARPPFPGPTATDESAASHGEPSDGSRPDAGSGAR